MTCDCKKGKKEHNEWFKNLLKEKTKKKRSSTKPVARKRRGMSTGGYNGKMEKL